MGCHSGTRVQNATELKRAAPTAGNRTVMIHPNGKQDSSIRFLAYCDITTDANIGWHLVFTAFPRDSSPYNNNSVSTNNRDKNGVVPLDTDTTMRKFHDDDIRTILNTGLKQTRTQWWHSSVQYPGTIWGDGSLTNNSTMYNEFDDPNGWSSAGTSVGQTFRRKRGLETSWSGTITSASGGCSEAAAGWSNYYEQSCVQSWRAACEGGPAFNHACAGGIQDRAEKLLIWAA